MAIDNNTKTWHDKILRYCLKHGISYAEFSRRSGISLGTIKNITCERCETIQLKSLAKLKNFIDNATI